MLQVGPDAFEQAASGAGPGGGGFNPFEDIFNGGSDVCKLFDGLHVIMKHSPIACLAGYLLH